MSQWILFKNILDTYCLATPLRGEVITHMSYKEYGFLESILATSGSQMGYGFCTLALN